MNVYIYQAALLCEACGEAERLRLINAHEVAHDIGDRDLQDSDEWPVGPYADGGGESDCPQHCDNCGLFLENPLTTDGYKYVKEAIHQWVTRGMGVEDVIKEWAARYDLPVV